MLEGVKKGPLGEVVVDNRMRTSIADVYACGDVVGPPYLTPVARHQGIVAADNILGIPRTMDYPNIPRSISLTHELAYLHQRDATAWGRSPSRGRQARVRSGPFPGADRHLQGDLRSGRRGSQRDLCRGAGGGLIAGYMAFLMKNHFSVHDFEEFIEVHPSTDGVYGLAKYASR